MKEYSEGEEVYGTKSIKQKLKEKYKDNVFFAEISGRKNVVCFQDMANWIVSDKWYEERNLDIDEEAKRIVFNSSKNHKGRPLGCPSGWCRPG